MRYEIHVSGLASPDPQYWVEIDGVTTYRLDLAYPHRKVMVEYGGYDAHERTAEETDHDRRLRELRDALAPSYSPLRKLERGPVRS